MTVSKHEKLVGLLSEAASRIRDIEAAVADHDSDLLALRVEDAGALAQDIEEVLEGNEPELP